MVETPSKHWDMIYPAFPRTFLVGRDLQRLCYTIFMFCLDCSIIHSLCYFRNIWSFMPFIFIKCLLCPSDWPRNWNPYGSVFFYLQLQKLVQPTLRYYLSKGKIFLVKNSGENLILMWLDSGAQMTSPGAGFFISLLSLILCIDPILRQSLYLVMSRIICPQS